MKKRKKKKKTKAKRAVKFVKLNTLSKADLAKINLDDLWVIKSPAIKPSARARFCGCRNVCLV